MHPWTWPSQLQGRLSRRQYVAAGCVAFILFFGVWHSLASAKYFREELFPPPWAAVTALFDCLMRDGWLGDVGISAYRIFLGFALSALIAVPTGVLIGSYRIAEALLEPFNAFIRYMPVVSFVPLGVLWFGIGDLQKIVIVFIGTYFQLVLLIAAVAARVPREYLETYFMLGGRRSRCVDRVILPAIWPEVFDALRISAAWAWSYLVVAELVAASSGIGFKIIQSQRFLQTPRVLAGIAIVGLLGLVTDFLFKSASRRLFPWVSRART